MSQPSGSLASPTAAVLCVDDEAAVRGVIVRTLSGVFRVVTATDGADGLRLLERDGPFAVVLADLNMPGMSGSTFLAEVRVRAPQTTRIMLTGATVGGAEQAVRDGTIFRFLTKPFSPPELLRSVREAVAYHRNVPDGTRHGRAA